MEIPQTLIELILSPQKIVITSHQKPDGDALGSTLALMLFLKNLNLHEVKVVYPSDFPDYYNWMPGVDQTEIFYEKEDQIQFLKTATLIFCLDFNSLDRIEKLGKYIEQSNAKKIMIDHHLLPQSFCEYQFSFLNVSSTAELVYDFIVGIKDDSYIDKPIAECIYTGILTDTGGFQFSCTKSTTHVIASKLLEKDINPDKIYNDCYNNFSLNRLKLFGHCIAQKMQIVHGHIAYICIGTEERNTYHIHEGDTEGLVNFPLKMNQIDTSILFKQDDGKIKISFRSKNDVDVCSIARAHFNGGGHRNAAGGTSFDTMEATVSKFLQVVKK